MSRKFESKLESPIEDEPSELYAVLVQARGRIGIGRGGE